MSQTPTPTPVQRAMAAIERIRRRVANLVSGGELLLAEQARDAAIARADACEAETESIVTAVEALAEEISPAPVEAEEEEEEPEEPEQPATPTGG